MNSPQSSRLASVDIAGGDLQGRDIIGVFGLGPKLIMLVTILPDIFVLLLCCWGFVGKVGETGDGCCE
jgi:hypothetical protein